MPLRYSFDALRNFPLKSYQMQLGFLRNEGTCGMSRIPSFPLSRPTSLKAIRRYPGSLRKSSRLPSQ